MSEAHAIRAAFFNKKLQKRKVTFSIPGLEEYDGKLAVRSLHTRDMRIINNLAVDRDGRPDPITAQAASICRALIIDATAERVFVDNDLDFIMGNDKPDDGIGPDTPLDGIDAFALKALGDLIGDLSGMNFNAVETWKKNSQIAQSNASASSSIENSEQQALV
jgi:hypothetical protein